jgi:putative peptide zinc metalloprotease protein
MNYVLNRAVTLSSLRNGSSAEVICEVPSVDGTASRFVFPLRIAKLLRLFDGTRTLDDVVRDFHLQESSDVSREKIITLVTGFFVPRYILVTTPERVESPAGTTTASYVTIRRRLLHPRVVSQLTRPFQWLFSFPAAVIVILAALISHLWFYGFLRHSYNISLSTVDGLDFIAITPIVIFCAFVHEMGHAAALAKHGAKNIEIGCGQYIYIPVLYTNVSEAWKLDRKERVIVDFGGIYFHLICATALLVFFKLYPIKLMLFAVLFIDMSIASSLNPFLRMDGYWGVADWFGIWNLRAQSLAFLRELPRFLLSPRSTRIGGLHTTRQTIVLITYVIFSTAFFIYLFVIMTYQILLIMLPQYPHMVLDTVVTIYRGEQGWVYVIRAILTLTWKTLIIFGALLWVYRGIAKYVRPRLLKKAERTRSIESLVN